MKVHFRQSTELNGLFGEVNKDKSHPGTPVELQHRRQPRVFARPSLESLLHPKDEENFPSRCNLHSCITELRKLQRCRVSSWLALSSFLDTLSAPCETILRDSVEEHLGFLTGWISDVQRQSQQDTGSTQHPRNSDYPGFSWSRNHQAVKS